MNNDFLIVPLILLAIGAGAAGFATVFVLMRRRKMPPRGFPIEPRKLD